MKVEPFAVQHKFQGKWPPKLEAFDAALSHRFPERQASYPSPGAAFANRGISPNRLLTTRCQSRLVFCGIKGAWRSLFL
jgi:hypothetical protein